MEDPTTGETEKITTGKQKAFRDHLQTLIASKTKLVPIFDLYSVNSQIK